MDMNNQQKTALDDTAETAPRRRRRLLKRLIRFSGNKIWVSEPVSVIIVCVLLVALVRVSQVMLVNEATLRSFDRELSELKAYRVAIEKETADLRERERLITQLKSVVGRRMREGDAVYKLADLIYTNSRQYGYAPELLLAVIAVESRFDPRALGRYRSGDLSGALGLMQIKEATAQEVANTLGMGRITKNDLLDPETNVILGTAYLTQLIARFKSFKLGIIAYNLGPGTVRGTLSRREQLPMRYYQKVLTQYYRLKAIGDEFDQNISDTDAAIF